MQQVSQLVNWTKGLDAAVNGGTASTINFAIPTTSTNRVLVVGVTCKRLSSSSFTVNTLTYGGVASRPPQRMLQH
jgi:hypothetical protein